MRKEVMNQIAEIMKGYGFSDLYELEPDISDGSSYDGFINYTDGFVDLKAAWNPIIDSSSVSVDIKNYPEATEAEEVYNKLIDNKSIIESFFYENKEEDWPWEDEDEFLKWYESFNPNDGHWEQLDLFTGEPTFTSTVDDNELKVYESLMDYMDSYYDDAQAYVGVRVMVYEGEDGNESTVKIDSYINDDLGYGRESVGRWAGNIGNHYVYSKEFPFADEQDLIKIVQENVVDAFNSVQ